MTDLEKTLDDLKLLNALCHGTVLDDAIALLKGQPQIVRCKNCNYYRPSESVADSGFCRHLKLQNPPYWFCYDGWRKEENDDAYTAD